MISPSPRRPTIVIDHIKEPKTVLFAPSYTESLNQPRAQKLKVAFKAQTMIEDGSPSSAGSAASGASAASALSAQSNRARKSLGQAFSKSLKRNQAEIVPGPFTFPEDRGEIIKHPDILNKEPRDFLLIGRVVLKKQRPLTEVELKHRQRESLLEKLNQEIKNLQKQKAFENKVIKTLGQNLQDYAQTKTVSGPMKNAAIEYAKRIKNF